MQATRHQHHFEDLSPATFERLVYWLVKESGDFDEVQRYGGARDKGRDVVAYKHTPAGREKWYIQCKRYQRITFFTLHVELAKLAQHAIEKPDFAPDVIVFTTACDVPPDAKDRASDYACSVNLAEPYYWGRLELDEMLKRQPRIEREFFGPLWNRLSPRHLLDIAITSPSGWNIAITLCLTVTVATSIILQRRIMSGHVFTPTPSYIALTLHHAFTPTPASTWMHTPTGTFTPTPASTWTPTPTDTPTPRPVPQPQPAPSRLTLVEPFAGSTTREIAVFRWQDDLENGQFFVVHLRHLATSFTLESRELTSNCWEARLPARLFGEWRWQVRVVQRSVVLARSEERHFWLNPFPREPLPTPRPCTE